jgi:adenosine deaminase
MSREMALPAEALGWGWAEFQWFTINDDTRSSCSDERLTIINEVIGAYAKPL